MLRITNTETHSCLQNQIFNANNSYLWYTIESGYDGNVFDFAADEKLLEHYVKELGAEPICMLHQFHFGIFEDKMKKIMEVYTYEWTDEQL